MRVRLPLAAPKLPTLREIKVPALSVIPPPVVDAPDPAIPAKSHVPLPPLVQMNDEAVAVQFAFPKAKVTPSATVTVLPPVLLERVPELLVT